MTDDVGEVLDFDSAVIIRPGDTLIVCYARPVSMEDAEFAKGLLRERLPGLADVVVIPDAAGLAVYRPGAGSGGDRP